MAAWFDQGTPKGLVRALSGHTVYTAQSKGWDTLSNGALLNAAEDVELLLTTDGASATSRLCKYAASLSSS